MNTTMSPPGGFGTSRYLMAVLAVFCAVVVLTGVLFFQYRGQILARAEVDAMNLAHVLDEHFEGTLKRVDADLLRLVRSIDPALPGAAGAARTEPLTQQLAAMRINFPEIGHVYIVDATGQLRYSSDPAAGVLEISGRDYFRRLRDDPGLQLSFSELIMAKTHGLPTVVVARAIRHPDGRFAGAALTLLDLQYWQQALGGLKIGEQGVITICRNGDGLLLLRQPERTGLLNTVENSPISQRIAAGEDLGVARFSSSDDGVVRLWAFRAVSGYPFNIAVALAEDDVLATWYQRLLTATLILSVLLGILLHAVYRVWHSERGHRAAVLALLESQKALHRNQENLLMANRLHRAVEESITESIWLLAANGQVVKANSTASRRLGLLPDDLIGRNAFDFFPDAIRPERESMVARSVASREVVSLEDVRNGRMFLNTCYPVLDERGHCDHVVVVAADVTELRSKEYTLAAQSRRLGDILEGTHVGTWEWHVAEGRLEVNERWAEIVGYSLDELQPITIETWRRLAHPEDLQRSDEAVASHLAGDRPYYECEIRMRHRSGEWVWVLDRGKVASRTEDGSPCLMSGTHQDISERKGLEAELDDYRQHLEQLVERRTRDLEVAKEAAEAAGRAKTAFLTMASHELRTPMNGIMGMLSLVRPHCLEEDGRHWLDKAEHSARQLLKVINDILDIARFESRRLTLACTPFTLGEVWRQVALGLDERAQLTRLSLRLHMPDELSERGFLGDPTRLAQMLFNLVDNAIKFTAQGEVSVSISELPPAAGKRCLRFAVRDTGIGIRAEDLQRIFEPFEQVDQSTTRRYGGTGLGLALCRRLVEAMQGQMGVLSEPGKGSTFWFEIRLDAQGGTESDAMAPGDDLLAHYRGQTVLLAEQDPARQEALRSLLEAAGLDVFLAADGNEVVESARSGGFDLILMGMHLPGLGSLEACYQIRGIPGHAQTPILALADTSFIDERDACIQAGMNDHIELPIAADAFYRQILRWLEEVARHRHGKH